MNKAIETRRVGDLKFMSRMRSAVEWSKQMDVDEEEVGGKEERKRGTWEEVSSVQKIHLVLTSYYWSSAPLILLTSLVMLKPSHPRWRKRRLKKANGKRVLEGLLG